ncbi:MAG TPA: MFS transporter [Bryobacteraceae bacterium]
MARFRPNRNRRGVLYPNNSRSPENLFAWTICGLLFLATVLNYMDRQTLSMTAPLIQRDLSLNNAQVGLLLSAFFYTYGIMQAVTGWLLDRVSVRLGYAISVLVWSLAGILTGFITNFRELLGCRLLLGVGEAANWPAALRTVARTMPADKRSLANGIFNSGASVGAIITPPLIVYISLRSNWRTAFIIIGLLGAIWLLLWLILTRGVLSLGRESTSPNVQEARSCELDTSLSSWPEILSSSRFWGLVVASVLAQPCYYFYSSWLPTYFVQRKAVHFGTTLGTEMLLAYVGLGLGSAVGGIPVFWLSKRAWSIHRARKVTVLGLCVLVVPIMTVPHTKSLVASIILVCAATFGMGAWVANYLSALQDLSRRRVASIAGIVGAFGAFAGALGMWAVGLVSSTAYGFGPVFVALGVMPIIGTLGIVLPRSPGQKQHSMRTASV